MGKRKKLSSKARDAQQEHPFTQWLWALRYEKKISVRMVVGLVQVTEQAVRAWFRGTVPHNWMSVQRDIEAYLAETKGPVLSPMAQAVEDGDLVVRARALMDALLALGSAIPEKSKSRRESWAMTVEFTGQMLGRLISYTEDRLAFLATLSGQQLVDEETRRAKWRNWWVPSGGKAGVHGGNGGENGNPAEEPGGSAVDDTDGL